MSRQDPDSGAIIREWQPNPYSPTTPTAPTGLETYRCLARSVISGGIRVVGTTERFGGLYDGVDYVQLFFPAHVELSRRDRVTNIRDASGLVVWKELERADNAPTIFNVVGVSPLFDPFGKHIENMTMLERVETQ